MFVYLSHIYHMFQIRPYERRFGPDQPYTLTQHPVSSLFVYAWTRTTVLSSNCAPLNVHITTVTAT